MSLIDEIKIKSFSEAQEILKAAGSEDIFEKAHKDGDLHPNGKWVWVSSAAGGKGDWRTLNGRTHKKHQASGIVGSGTVSSSAVNSTGSGNSVGGNKSVNTTTGASSKNTSTTKKVKSDFDDTFKPKQKVKTNSETYSHDINGVSVNVSKNKDGSYTLEANGKKVKSDDPSFFKDKLTPRVKKALAKELGIESTTAKKTSMKKTTATKTQTFEAKNAADYDKGDGKIGNYPKPQTQSLRASAILGMMHNNRHFGFKYGMDTQKIKAALEASGDKLVTVDMHNNAGTNEIYRIKFD